MAHHLLNDKKSYAGMAYLAETGPAGTRCSACAFFRPRLSKRTKKPMGDGTCRKWESLMNLRPAPRFPEDTKSCMYFEAIKEGATPSPFIKVKR